LIGILEYIASGGPVEPLLIGKLSERDIPLIEELQWRKVLHAPPLYPRYLMEPEAKKRLEEIREKGLNILDLIERSQR